MVSSFAKLDAERRAKKKGLMTVTRKEVDETDKGYEDTLGKEAMEQLRAMARGEGAGPEMAEEFFVEEPEEMYSIEICPSKYGASTRHKRENIKRLITPLRKKLKELKVTDLMIDLATTSLMMHHQFRIVLAGCPNACISPYVSDFGVLGVYIPKAKDSGCTECGTCVDYCSEEALSLANGRVTIDYEKCIGCEGCVERCEEGVLYTDRQGYKVVVGGSGSRHPQIARTVTDMTDVQGVLAILERCVGLIQEAQSQGRAKGGRVFTLKDLIDEAGVERLVI
jgi:ferredoxin